MDVEASTREPRVGFFSTEVAKWNFLRRPGFHLRELLRLRPKYEEVLPLPRGGLNQKKRQHKSWGDVGRYGCHRYWGRWDQIRLKYINLQKFDLYLGSYERY